MTRANPVQGLAPDALTHSWLYMPVILDALLGHDAATAVNDRHFCGFSPFVQADPSLVGLPLPFNSYWDIVGRYKTLFENNGITFDLVRNHFDGPNHIPGNLQERLINPVHNAYFYFHNIVLTFTGAV